MFEKVRNYSGGSKDIKPGVYVVKVANLMQVENDYGTRVQWQFEVFSYPDLKPLFDEFGQPLRVVDWTSTSLGPQAKARKWAEALLQRPLAEGEGGDELADELMGRMAIATVVKNQNGYPRVDSLAPLPNLAHPSLPGMRGDSSAR